MDKTLANAEEPSFSQLLAPHTDEQKYYLVLRTIGMSNNETCTVLDVTPRTVSQWRFRLPSFKASMDTALSHVHSYELEAKTYFIGQLEAKSLLFLSKIIDNGIEAFKTPSKRDRDYDARLIEQDANRKLALRAIDKIIRLMEIRGKDSSEEMGGWMEMVSKMRDTGLDGKEEVIRTVHVPIGTGRRAGNA